MGKEQMRVAFRDRMQYLIDKARNNDADDTDWIESIYFEGHHIYFFECTEPDEVLEHVWFLRIEVQPKGKLFAEPISVKESWYGFDWDPYNEKMVNEIVDYVVDVIAQDMAK